MKKYPELDPKEKKYLENLFHASEYFQGKVEELRNKYDIQLSSWVWKKVESLYTDTLQFFRWNEEVAKRYTPDNYIKWKSFHDDLDSIAEYFYIEKYSPYFKKYVLGRSFEPLSFQKILHSNKNCITLELPYQIWKKEFLDIWKDIESVKNSHIWREAIKKWRVQKRYRKDAYFDAKFLYHKENKYWEELPKHLKKEGIDESNKYGWIREIEEARILLVT